MKMENIAIRPQTVTMLRSLFLEKSRIETQIQLIVDSYLDASGIELNGTKFNINLDDGNIIFIEDPASENEINN